MTILRPVAYLSGRTLATRLLYTLLRGVTATGSTFSVKNISNTTEAPPSQRSRGLGSPHGFRGTADGLSRTIPRSRHSPAGSISGVNRFLANRMEFRDGVATGRLLLPVVRPRGLFAWIASGDPDGGIAPSALVSQLGVKDAARIEAAIQTRNVNSLVNATAAFGSANPP